MVPGMVMTACRITFSFSTVPRGSRAAPLIGRRFLERRSRADRWHFNDTDYTPIWKADAEMQTGFSFLIPFWALSSGFLRVARQPLRAPRTDRKSTRLN